MEKISLDVVKNSSPFFIFWERDLTHGVEDFSYTLPYGFGYYLRRIVTRYDGVNTATGTLAPPLFIEFIDNWNNRMRQAQPIDLSLLSTPNNGGNMEHEIQSATPHTFTVKVGKSSEKMLNYYHPFNDVIRFKISGGGVALATYPLVIYPSIQIMLDGNFFPEEKYSAVFGNLCRLSAKPAVLKQKKKPSFWSRKPVRKIARPALRRI
jgi:hypothetical protein